LTHLKNGKILVMNQFPKNIEREFKEVRKFAQHELIERHKGLYHPTISIENHLLPFERYLKKKDRGWFEKLDPIMFLYLPLRKATPVALTKRNFQEACEFLYNDSKTGKDYLQNAKKTISLHIEKITGINLFKWMQKGPHQQDAFRTGYLLYQLQLATPGGLEMLTKEADPRFAEVELFTGHHPQENRKTSDKNTQVILLSAWLKDLFSKTLFHRSEVERAMLKNLDTIFTGYLHVYTLISSGKINNEKELLTKIFDSRKVQENNIVDDPLSVILMRTWQMKRHKYNLSNQTTPSIMEAFLCANKLQHSPITRKRIISDKDKKVIRLGAKIFCWIIFQIEYKKSTKILDKKEILKLLMVAQQRESKLYFLIKSDVENSVRLISKGIGEDCKKTSILNTIKLLVKNNEKVLDKPINQFTVLNMNNNCETHYNYLIFRANHLCNYSHIPAEEFIHLYEKELKEKKEINEFITTYINSMSINELHEDIQRINGIISKLINAEFRLHPPASGLVTSYN
jgi:hypothetical protein